MFVNHLANGHFYVEPLVQILMDQFCLLRLALSELQNPGYLDDLSNMGSNVLNVYFELLVFHI